jgi:protein-S-isoprenylcysteine O-methyltransferase Ste14
MHFVRRSFLVLVGVVLPFLLFATALDFGVLRVAGSPEPVKKILADSGIYSSLVSSALDQAQKSTSNSGEVSLTDPAIKKAAQESFSPQVVQSSTEKVINGVYDWLDGKTSEPDFSVDLTSTKTTFAEKVGQAAKTRAAGLPVCTSAPASTDPLSATCLPPGVTPTQIGEQAKNSVLSGQGFLEHPNITAGSIKNSNSGQSVFDTSLKDAPKRYRLAKKTPFILSGLTILAVLAVIFLHSSRRQGLRRAGIIVAAAGVFMLFFAWSLNRAVAENVIPKISLDNKVLTGNVQILASEVTQKIDQNYWIFAIGYLALGILAILVTLLIRKGGKKVPAAASSQGASQPPAHKPASSPPQRPTAPKPKSPPKIQG